MLSDTLSRKENEVMNAVYSLSCGKERFLVSPEELLAVLPPKGGYSEEKLERLLTSLEMDGYFEHIASERKGERVWVFHMRPAGLDYKRSGLRRRRSVCFRWGVGAVGAVITFLVGLLLRAVFR